jgi:hypothetical protein
MRTFKLFNNIFGWVIFAVAAVVYLMTIEPTASFWDCGEFISSAYKLEVGHPPGAPFFMITANFFTLFASDPSQVAMMVNSFSALCSAFCILFLFWTITHLARKIVLGNNTEFSKGQIIGIIGSGIVGALAYTFSDTFWFSAVEGEVYAYSSFFTAIVFWAILKWEDVADQPYSNRWLVLIAYLMGLSIGVHLLNLLAIPAIVLVYYYKKYNPTTKGMLTALGVSFLLLAVLLYGLVPGFVEVGGWFEILFVNKLGLPFDVGTLVYAILVISCLVWGVWETSASQKSAQPVKSVQSVKSVQPVKSVLLSDSGLIRANIAFILSVTLLGIPFFGGNIFLGIVLIIALTLFLFLKKHLVNMAMMNLTLLCFTVILLGYSSYAMIVIRSDANPPMDQNSPDDVFALKNYLNRDQYGDTPLLFGESYASELKWVRAADGRGWEYDTKQGNAIWAKKIKASPDEKDEYIITDYKKKYKYADGFNMLFPRMYSKQPTHIEAYKEWANITGKRITYQHRGETKSAIVPTFGENLKFFIKYQVGFMYFRYFMWNFAGRQSDIQGNGEITNGNWISGISFIDNYLVGDQTNLPDEMKNNKARNTYYFLPLLLGILGIFYQFSKGEKGVQSFWITFILFFMTGLAIVLYLNQSPYQPRERDYAYAGSFYAFCIWIGLGVLAIAKLLSKALDKRISGILATLICLPVPILMATENWDDHDRSGRYTCRDFGQNYLASVAPNGIIFTNGDNDTFPLWYNQEVEGFRTDTRVTNLSYLQTSWYVDQMKRQAYESDSLPISLQPYQYSNGKLDVAHLIDIFKEPINVKTAIDLLKNSDTESKKLKRNLTEMLKRQGYDADNFDFLPSKKLFLPVDSAAAIKHGAVKPEDARRIVDKMDIDLSQKSYLGKHEIVILDMLQTNNWERPIYFAVTVGPESYMGLRDYFQLEGMAYRVVPVKGGNRVNTEVMYDNMMNKFKWGGIENPKVYLDENNLRMTSTLRRMFSTLAGALIVEGKKDSALTVLDYCMKVIPSETVPHNYFSVILASQYYQLGQKEKAEAILNEVLDNSLQHLKWFSSLNNDQELPSRQPSAGLFDFGLKREIHRQNQLRSASADFAQHLGILQEVFQIAQRFGNEEIMESNLPLYMQYAQIYESIR